MEPEPRAYASTVLEPEAGNLFACRWEPDDDREPESLRIVEVVAEFRSWHPVAVARR